MDLALGSTNPAKRMALERTLDRYDPTVNALTVDSGVPDQPRTREETIRGATNRAENAYATGDYAYGVGLEGGMASIESLDGEWLVMWAVVTDGERIERAGGPTLRLPQTISERLADAELGSVLDDHYDRQNVGEDVGAAGLLTDGLTDRPTALGQAIAGSFGPFLRERGTDRPA